jgi:hypothetical protein
VHRADEVQLTAQAICLEEMFGVEIPEGALLYGARRRHQTVPFDAELRALTARVADEARTMIAAGRTPAPVYEAKKCKDRQLNTLYVTTQGAWLNKDGANVWRIRGRPRRISLRSLPRGRQRRAREHREVLRRRCQRCAPAAFQDRLQPERHCAIAVALRGR